MRVLWFTNTPTQSSQKPDNGFYGGGWISSLEKHLSKAGEVELGIAFYHDVPAIQSFTKSGTRYFAMPVYRDKGKWRGLARRWNHAIEPEKILNHCHEVIRQFDPDIIQVFGTEKNFGLLCRKATVPVLIHIQGILTEVVRHWYDGVKPPDILRFAGLKDLILGYNLWHQYYCMRKRAAREKEIFRLCSFFLGRTAWDLQNVKTLSPHALYFKGEEILRDEFYEVPNERPPGTAIRLLSVIGPNTYKGLDTIIMTAQLLNRQHGVKFKWMIAGINGDEEIVRVLQKKYKFNYDGSSVFFLGTLDAPRLVTEMKKVRIFVHPAHIDNSPNSVCEAMMAGLPVIAVNTGGVPGLINDGIDGLLVPKNDIHALAGMVIQLAGDAGLQEKFSQNARRRALERHDPVKIVVELIKTYRHILDISSKKDE